MMSCDEEPLFNNSIIRDDKFLPEIDSSVL
jgi:hypothetical protein